MGPKLKLGNKMKALLRRIRLSSLFNDLKTAIKENKLDQTESVLLTLKREGVLERPEPDLLHFACDSGNRSEIVSMMIDYGYQTAIQEVDKFGFTPLHLAVQRGDEETVSVLLAAGADPNARDKSGATPLNVCKSFEGLSEIANALIQAGANPNLVDKHGKTYLM